MRGEIDTTLFPFQRLPFIGGECLFASLRGFSSRAKTYLLLKENQFQKKKVIFTVAVVTLAKGIIFRLLN